MLLLLWQIFQIKTIVYTIAILKLFVHYEMRTYSHVIQAHAHMYPFDSLRTFCNWFTIIQQLLYCYNKWKDEDEEGSIVYRIGKTFSTWNCIGCWMDCCFIKIHEQRFGQTRNSPFYIINNYDWYELSIYIKLKCSR